MTHPKGYLKVLDKLVAAREAAYYTGYSASQALSMSPWHLSAIERGRVVPKVTTLMRMAELYRVPVKLLFKD